MRTGSGAAEALLVGLSVRALLRSAMSAARRRGRRPLPKVCVVGLLLLSLACNTCFTCLFPALTNSGSRTRQQPPTAAQDGRAGVACLSLRQPINQRLTPPCAG